MSRGVLYCGDRDVRGDLLPWPWALIPVVLFGGNAWRLWPVTDAEPDGRTLFLSRRGRTAEIPLADVSRVEVDMLHGAGQAMRLVFSRQTPLGSWLTVEVPWEGMATAYDHRSIRELRALIAQARAAAAQDAAAGGVARGSSAR